MLKLVIEQLGAVCTRCLVVLEGATFLIELLLIVCQVRDTLAITLVKLGVIQKWNQSDTFPLLRHTAQVNLDFFIRVRHDVLKTCWNHVIVPFGKN